MYQEFVMRWRWLLIPQLFSRRSVFLSKMVTQVNSTSSLLLGLHWNTSFSQKKQWTLDCVKFPAQIDKSTKRFPKVSLETFCSPNFAALVCGSLPFISKAQIWHRQNIFIRYYIYWMKREILIVAVGTWMIIENNRKLLNLVGLCKIQS